MGKNKQVGKLPKISDELMKHYQNCSNGFVKRHHMCGGCIKGQFYCDLFDKWRDQWDRRVLSTNK